MGLMGKGLILRQGGPITGSEDMPGGEMTGLFTFSILSPTRKNKVNLQVSYFRPPGYCARTRALISSIKFCA